MDTTAKEALRKGLEARETPASHGVDLAFVENLYNNRLKPLMAKGTFRTPMPMGELIKFMMELLAFSSYARLHKYDVDTWDHDPVVTLGARSLTPDFYAHKTKRYVEIYSPAQGHGASDFEYLANLDRTTIETTLLDKSIKYTGLQIDITVHLSTMEFPSDYVRAIRKIPPVIGQRFILFQGDKEIDLV